MVRIRVRIRVRARVRVRVRLRVRVRVKVRVRVRVKPAGGQRRSTNGVELRAHEYQASALISQGYLSCNKAGILRLCLLRDRSSDPCQGQGRVRGSCGG